MGWEIWVGKYGLENIGRTIWVGKYGLENMDSTYRQEILVEKYGHKIWVIRVGSQMLVSEPIIP